MPGGGSGQQDRKAPGFEVDRFQTRLQVRGVYLIRMVSKNEKGAHQVSDVNQVRQTPVVFGFVRLVVMEYRFAYALGIPQRQASRYPASV